MNGASAVVEDLGEMTLGEFLDRAGVVHEQSQVVETPQGQLVYRNNNNYNGIIASTSGGGWSGAKRRAVQQPPLDKATQQNKESCKQVCLTPK